MSAEDNGRVSFTTKELLQRLDEKLDRIDEKIDSKADRQSVHDIRNRLASLELIAVNREGPIIRDLKAFEILTESRLATLEEQNRLTDALQESRDKGLSSWGTRISMLAGLASVIAVAITAATYFH